MNRANGPSQAVLGHLGHPGDRRLAQSHVGGDDGQGRVCLAKGARYILTLRPQGRDRVGEATARIARASQCDARAPILNIAKRIRGDESGDDHPAGERSAGAAQAALHRGLHAQRFSAGRARARPGVALGKRAGRRGVAGRVAGFRPGPPAAQGRRGVKQDRGRDDRDDGWPGRVTNPALLQPAHHAIRGGQAKGAAAAEQDGVHPLDLTGRIEQVGFAGARRAPAHIDPGHGALRRAQDDGAARAVGRVGPVPDFQTGDIGQIVVHGDSAPR